MNEVASEITRRLLQVSYLPGIGTVALRKVVMLAAEMGLESISDDNEILRKFNKSNAKTGKQCGDILYPNWDVPLLALEMRAI